MQLLAVGELLRIYQGSLLRTKVKESLGKNDIFFSPDEFRGKYIKPVRNDQSQSFFFSSLDV